MVYIDRNGRVLEKRPWNLHRVMEVLLSFWFLVVKFFTTLIAPFRGENRGRSRNTGSGWGPGGGGGGSGAGGSSGSNGGLRPNRRIGRITNSMDCDIPGGG